MKSPQPLHIFKAGRHTAMSGQAIDFSAADLAASAAAYDPAKHEAPIVVGHPRTDAPAYGWVAALSAGSDGLEALPHQVDPGFADLVEAGRYKKISASFFLPDAPANPVPGVYYLRHVGFLGAVPPAVKGLRAPEFAAGQEGVVEFADPDDALNAGLWRRLRDFFIGQFGLEKADAVIPSDEVTALEAEAAADAAAEATNTDTPAVQPAFSDPPVKGDPMSTQDRARLAQLEAENQALRDAALARAASERHAANAAFADGLLKEGRLAPGHVASIVALLDFASDHAEASIEFSEGETTKTCAPLDALKTYLGAQPKLIEFAERSADTSAPAGVAAFAAPAGYAVDAGRLELLTRAQSYAAEHKVTLDDALKAIA